jgi:hypothetical protein
VIGRFDELPILPTMRTARVLSDAVNGVVVHVEGRRYPGLVVQGDRLKEWKRLALAGDPDSVAVLADALSDASAWLDDVLRSHGLNTDG